MVMAKVEIVNKPWGKEEILVKTNNYVMKRITITKGHRMSLQYHELKEETIYVLSGNVLNWNSLEFEDFITIPAGEIYHVEPEKIHRFGAPDQEDVIILECSTVELSDVVRLADDYNRG